MSLDPDEVVASFDSASVLHAATAAAPRRERFPHLGNPDALARLVRVGGRLPWPVLKQIYARIGGAEGIDPDALGDVDMEQIAAAFADGYPARRYRAVFVGSSNGALTHAAAAMQVPWLPNTVPTEEKFTPDFVDRDPADGQPEGGDGLAWFWERFGESFSDVQIENVETIATPEHLVTVARLCGRHTGEYRGHPATGRTFEVRNVQVFRFEDGRAAERFGSTDELGILTQLGLVG